jgi:hypothetical protein
VDNVAGGSGHAGVVVLSVGPRVQPGGYLVDQSAERGGHVSDWGCGGQGFGGGRPSYGRQPVGQRRSVDECVERVRAKVANLFGLATGEAGVDQWVRCDS